MKRSADGAAASLAGKAESAQEIARLKEDVAHYITVGVSRGMWAAAYKKSAKRWRGRAREVLLEMGHDDRSDSELEASIKKIAPIVAKMVFGMMPGFLTDQARKWLRDNGFQDPFLT